MKPLLYLTALLLAFSSIASAVDCPPGFDWQRMSGVGCVQSDCVKVGGSYGYTKNCFCRKETEKGCYEQVNYTAFDAKKCGANCPYSKLIACVPLNASCPNEKKATTTSTTKKATTTTKKTVTTTPIIDIAQTGITLPNLSSAGVVLQDKKNETPKNESCLDFGVKPEDFDLTYDDKELRKMFEDFLKEYQKNNKVNSASKNYSGWDPADFLALGFFMFTKDMNYSRRSGYWTGNEARLGNAITQRNQNQGKPLTPTEVLEESLKVNNNNMFDALLCTHNYMKSEVYNARDVRTDSQMEIKKDKELLQQYQTRLDDELKKAGYMSPTGEVMESSQMLAFMQENTKVKNIMDLMKKTDEKVQANQRRYDNAAASFDRLQRLRRSDNEGAWYHLFGTMTTGYAERENTFKFFGDSAYTRIELWGEHRIYKGLLGRREGSTIDWPEYCWDVWGGYLGGELYSKVDANKPTIIRAVESRPPGILDVPDMGYVKDAYSGEKIYK